MSSATASLALCANTFALSPEDALLLCCVHGASHLWYYLQSVSDVAEIIRASNRLDWACLAENAKRLQADRMLFSGLLLAHDLLGADIPDAILHRARDDATTVRMARSFGKQMFASTRHKPTDLEVLFGGLRLQKSRRLCSLFSIVFTPTVQEYDLFPLPQSLFKLYYVLRPVRLLAAYGPQLVKSLR